MNWTIREAQADEFYEIAKLHVAGWQAAYADIVDSAYLEALSVDERAENWRKHLQDPSNKIYLAHDGLNQPVGFANCGPTFTIVI
ncbi:MAG: hypothetical protein H6861_04050 [Rhodospirillales bacterium]|nr:hypothetical protein [Rhodospirillales bacterium]